jgi:tetratricopeptide (TPR) repeat protein
MKKRYISTALLVIMASAAVGEDPIPTLSEFHSRGYKAFAAGEKEKALAIFAEAHKKFPEDAYVSDNLAGLLMLKKDYDEALAVLEQAHKNHPKDAAIIEKLGHVYLKLKRFPDAVKVYTEGTKILPDKKEFWHGLGTSELMIMAENGGGGVFTDASVRALDKATKIDPKDADIWFTIGEAYYLRIYYGDENDRAEVIASYKKADELGYEGAKAKALVAEKLETFKQALDRSLKEDKQKKPRQDNR